MSQTRKIIIAIIITVTVAGGMVYFWREMSKSSAQSRTFSIIKEWQIYQNERYGYSIQYPSYWEASKQGQYVSFSAKEIKTPDDYRLVDVEVSGVSLEDFVENYEKADPPFSKIEKQEEYILDGIKGTKLTGATADGSGQNFIFVRKDNKSYIIYFHDYYDTNLKMLSTFKFIKGTLN